MTNLSLSAAALALSARILAAAGESPSALAEALSAALVKDTRADGASFVKFADLTPEAAELAQSVSFAAHDSGSFLPDDWTYSKLGALLDGAASEGEDYDASEDCDIYTRALLVWLADGNGAELDEYVSEFGWPGSIDQAVMGAQAEVLRRAFADVWAALESACLDFVAEDSRA